MSNRCGDPSARLLERMTLNPIKHIDIVGTVIMPLLMIFSQVPYLFGWAKPVPVNPRNLRNMRRDSVLVAVAGPSANILLAITCTLVMRIFVLVNGDMSMEDFAANPVVLILITTVMINITLALFNCLPFPPLDGSHVLYYFLPESGKNMLEQFAPFGLMAAILIGGKVIAVPQTYISHALLSYAFLGF